MDLRFLWALPIAFVFSFWPLMSKSLGVSPGLFAAWVMMVTGLTTVIFARGEYKPLPWPVVAVILILSILNAWGCNKYPKVIMEMGSRGGVFVGAVAVSIMFISFLVSIRLLHYVPTKWDYVGMLTGIITIAIFSTKPMPASQSQPKQVEEQTIDRTP